MNFCCRCFLICASKRNSFSYIALHMRTTAQGLWSLLFERALGQKEDIELGAVTSATFAGGGAGARTD